VNILSQHAIQGDLGDLEQSMCQWMAYSLMVPMGISHEFLFDILARLIAQFEVSQGDSARILKVSHLFS
jgi:hypothetical protein